MRRRGEGRGRHVPGMVWLVMTVAFVLAVAMAPAHATTAESDARASLNKALGLSDLLEVMRIEGQRFGEGVGADFLPGGGGAIWHAVVTRIYDLDKMRISTERGLKAEIAADQIAPLLTFFTSETGHKIVAQEIHARRAFLDAETEDTARAAYRAALDDPAKATRIALLRAYVEANQLVEFNVTGALNANLRFYRGLVDGGAYEMSEEEMMSAVWEQEDETRADTDEWLMAYLYMAYAPLSDAQIKSYTALSKTEAGKALNRGLFAGFDQMYEDISYALGLAIAQQMQGEDL
ncbi:DUF2059 domain-containing protein [Aquicoccus sp. G2-2]|uniref:DUF2059 domain-containing protein n=1 Tax=Aquicoccus sp. G2-2 TaxID=3092120 RepID=UPI002ADF5BF6|nr:DUF2059 domain-containing protein [Aquicoccus sp. G2-2]MEA1113193.1 DUF2059 domain-containing protein [Aquicoccus sp. G2-2]